MCLSLFHFFWSFSSTRILNFLIYVTCFLYFFKYFFFAFPVLCSCYINSWSLYSFWLFFLIKSAIKPYFEFLDSLMSILEVTLNVWQDVFLNLKMLCFYRQGMLLTAEQIEWQLIKIRDSAEVRWHFLESTSHWHFQSEHIPDVLQKYYYAQQAFSGKSWVLTLRKDNETAEKAEIPLRTFAWLSVSWCVYPQDWCN